MTANTPALGYNKTHTNFHKPEASAAAEPATNCECAIYKWMCAAEYLSSLRRERRRLNKTNKRRRR